MNTFLVGLSHHRMNCQGLHYCSGAMVLAHSLRDSGSKKTLAILVTLDSISSKTIDELKVRIHHV